jgi:hypothetical protein
MAKEPADPVAKTGISTVIGASVTTRSHIVITAHHVGLAGDIDIGFGKSISG